MFAVVIERHTPTERSDARKRFAATVLRMDIVGLQPQEKIVWIFFYNLFAAGDHVLDRFGIRVGSCRTYFGDAYWQQMKIGAAFTAVESRLLRRVDKNLQAVFYLASGREVNESIVAGVK